MTDALDLFPETMADAAPTLTEWTGLELDKWGNPRVTVRLISRWEELEGWHVGWFVMVDKALDEWHPAAPERHKQHAYYPWYRLDEIPVSRRFGIAAGVAARAVKIVLEQMLQHTDSALTTEVRQLSDDLETQARRWLMQLD